MLKKGGVLMIKHLLKQGVKLYGWKFFDQETQERLRNEFLDMPIIDVSGKFSMPVNLAISPNDVIEFVRGDVNVQDYFKKKFGNDISINQMVSLLEDAPLLKDIIIAKTANKINRVLTFLVMLHTEDENYLTDDQVALLSLLLNKFGASIGCPSPELFEEKVKAELELLLEFNITEDKK